MSNAEPLRIHDVFAYLRVHDTAEALDFYARAFGAQELSASRRRTARSATRRPASVP